MQEEPNKYVKELTQEKYKYGFTTEVHTDIIERGLNEDVIRLISAKKNGPLGNGQEIAMAIFIAIVQGILMAGLSTYVNQIIKQANKDE